MGAYIATLGPEHNLQRRIVALVSENYFALLGARPLEGRFFSAAESQPGAGVPVVVANYALWERLGRPANFVGSKLRVENQVCTVIGLAPRGFGGFHVSIGPDVWLPLGAAGTFVDWKLENPATTRFSLYARLAPGVTLEAATARLASAERRLNALPPVDSNGARRLLLTTPSRTSFGSSAPEDESLLPKFGAVAFGLSLTVLLIACLNLSNMLLARGVARRKELAIRLSLGATRWCVVRGLLAEGLLLALLGGALSLVIGQWANDLLYRWSNDAFSAGLFNQTEQTFIDPTVVVATLGFSLLATLLFCLWPALRVTRPDLVSDLKQIGREPASGGRANRWYAPAQLPLLAQIALSLALLFSAALFVRGAENAQSLDLGFRTDQQLVAQLDFRFLPLEGEQIVRRQQALLESTASLAGVASAAFASNVPYNFDLPHRSVQVAQGAGTAEGDRDRARFGAGYTAVTRGYFGTMGIALLRGRDFTPEESAGGGGAPVAVIDETLARALFGENDALGRYIVFDHQRSAPAREIVGIVRGPRHDVFQPLPRRIYLPLGQSPEIDVFLHLRTAQPLALVDRLRNHLQATEPGAPVLVVRPMAEFVTKNINVLLVRLGGAIFGVFGGIALVLAVVGVYGVKAHSVARRTREIGVRVALGARPQDIMTLVLKQGAAQAAIGIAFGIGLALLAGRGLAALLYRVDPADLFALGLSALLLAFAVLAACWVPARRAMKVDPIVAIRTE